MFEKSRTIAQFESRLVQANTLEKVQKLAREASSLDGKTAEIAQSFFTKLYDKMGALAEREIERLEAKGDKIEALRIKGDFFYSPEEVERELSVLREEAELEVDSKVKEAALRKLGVLEFSSRFSTVGALEEFSKNVGEVSQKALQQGMLPSGFSQRQLQEILRGA